MAVNIIIYLAMVSLDRKIFCLNVLFPFSRDINMIPLIKKKTTRSSKSISLFYISKILPYRAKSKSTGATCANSYSK